LTDSTSLLVRAARLLGGERPAAVLGRPREGPAAEDPADRLAKRSAELRGRPDFVRGVEETVAAAIGARVRQVGSAAVRSPRSDIDGYVAADRVHGVHRLVVEGRPRAEWDAPGGEIAVFVKTGRNLAPSPSVLSTLRSPDFRAPRPLGGFGLDDLRVEVSEHLDGERRPFRSLAPEARDRLVRAVAAVNAAPARGVDGRTRWLGVPLDWMEARCAEHGAAAPEAWREAARRIARIDAMRGEIKAAIRGGRLRVFTHNDLSPGNVAFGPEGEVRIFDWEKASRSLPGADLRFLLEMNDGDRLIDLYLERMGELGVALDRGRLLRTIDVLEGFRRLRAGCANGAIQNVVSGLSLIEKHFPA
jgi:hypothetical protein